MRKLTYYTAIVLLLFTAVNAIIAGGMFIVDRSGGLLGMTTEYLKHSPFPDFLLPGIILLSVNGFLNIFAAVQTIRKTREYFYFIIIQGVLLCGWILVQMIMVQDINLLHFVMFSIGTLLIICGIIQRKFRKNLY